MLTIEPRVTLLLSKVQEEGNTAMESSKKEKENQAEILLQKSLEERVTIRRREGEDNQRLQRNTLFYL